MIHVCVTCMLQQPSLFVLSAEQRKVFQKIISPDVNYAELEHLKLLVCINCLRQVKLVQAFQQKALRGARNLIMLYKRMEQQNLLLNTIQVKEELDPLSSSTTIVPKYPAPIKDEPQNIISEEPGTHDREITQENSLSEELVDENEPEADYSDSDTTSTESEGEKYIRKSTTESVEKLSNTITETQNDVHFEVLTHGKSSENQSSKLTSKAANVSPSLGDNTRNDVPIDGTLSSSTSLKKCVVPIPQPPQPYSSIKKDKPQHRRRHNRPLSAIEKQEVLNTYKRLNDNWPIYEYHSKGILQEKTAEIHGISPKTVATIVNRTSTRKKCTECDMTLSGSSLRIHMLVKHTKATPGKCDICGFVCKNEVWLLKHKRMKHTVEVEVERSIDNLNLKWYCSECQVQYATETRFKHHMMTLKHASRDQWRFECNTCHRKYPTKTRLEEHVNIQHLKKYIYKCDKCDKSYGKRGTLKNHVAVVHDKQKARKQYVCHQCGAAFTVEKTLKEHLFKHSGERPYACPLCPATFTYRAALYTHNKLKHLKIKRKWPQRNRKRGNRKAKKNAEGIDQGTKRIGDDKVGTEKGMGGTDLEDRVGLGGDTEGMLIDILQDNNFG